MRERDQANATKLAVVIGAGLLASTGGGALVAEFAVGRVDARNSAGASPLASFHRESNSDAGDTGVTLKPAPKTAWAAPLPSAPVKVRYVDDNKLEDDLARLEAQWRAEDRARDRENRAREAELRASLDRSTTQSPPWTDNHASGLVAPANPTPADMMDEPDENSFPG